MTTATLQPTALDGMPVVVCDSLAVEHKVIVSDGTIYVSPMLFSLMVEATSDELQELFRGLLVLEVDKFSFAQLTSNKALWPPQP